MIFPGYSDPHPSNQSAMKLTAILLIILLGISSAYSQDTAQQARQNYAAGILKLRTDKDLEYRTDPKSPLPEEARAGFEGLNYFPPDSTYRVYASFTRYDNPLHFLMKTTTDRLPEYNLYGKATFVLNGLEMSLNVYQNIELLKKPGYQDYLFIPFNDPTNDIESYGGGRFIDGQNNSSDTLVIDFNLAYNPYCAYNHKYSCPIPPKENTLPMRIEAGERKWKK